MAKSRFTRLDAFAKTVEDARIRTNSGGVITIASLLIVMWLVWGEWADYRRIVVQPELVVDKSRGMNRVSRSDASEDDWGKVTNESYLMRRRENGDSSEHDLPSVAM